MKGPIFISTVLLLLLGTLSAFQYQVLHTTSPTVKVVNGHYTFENSTVKLVYNLWADRGMFAFVLLNKSDKPIYINWEKSFFTFNGTNYDYREDNGISGWGQDTSGRAFAFAFNWQKSLMPAPLTKITTGEKNITAIPPHSAIGAAKYRLILETLSLNGSEKTKDLCEGEKDKWVMYWARNYSADNSPFTFQNTLACSYSADFDQPQYFKHEFWVNQIAWVSDAQFYAKSVARKPALHNCLYTEGTSYYVSNNVAKYRQR